MDWKTAASQAAVLAAVVATTGFILGWKQHKQAKVRFGYDLLDDMIEDESVCNLLDVLDTQHAAQKVVLVTALEKIGKSVTAEEEQFQYDFDGFLWYLDRFEHAIQSGVTSFDVLRMPTGYYLLQLAKHRQIVEHYMEAVGYDRARSFARRFKFWTT